MRRSLPLLAAALLLLTAFASPAFAGPPWMSIELPANPMIRSYQGAFLLVRTFHHGVSEPMELEARAEGMVDGQRKAVPLTLESTGTEGVYALKQAWPDRGEWVIVIVGQPGAGSITALVSIDDGVVRGVRVPSRKSEDGRWNIPVQVTQADIDAELRTLVSLAAR